MMTSHGLVRPLHDLILKFIFSLFKELRTRYTRSLHVWVAGCTVYAPLRRMRGVLECW
jgi:hypothetical protein